MPSNATFRNADYWTVYGRAALAAAFLGLALLIGVRTRTAAALSGCLILLFGIGMTAGTGFKSALNASVFAASAGGFLLARAPRFPITVDEYREARSRRHGTA